jgi:1,4-dihydroxy-2-naphthoate octaprenyltransferase
MNSLSILKVIRVHIVLGGILAYSLGVLLALTEGARFEPTLVFLGYLVVLFGDLSTHFSNDFFDAQTDRTNGSKKFFSNDKILVTQPQLRHLSKVISITLFSLSNALAAIAVLAFNGSNELFFIAFAANVLGWIYSAPPIRLSSRGLGEITIAVATGFIIPSIGYLTVKGLLDYFFVSLSIPFMMYGFLLSVNLSAPDIRTDSDGEKGTFSVRIGQRNVFLVTLAILLLATFTFFNLTLHVITKVVNLNTIFLLSLVPLMAGLFGFATSFKKRDLNQFSTLNIFSLFLLNIGLITYLVILLV